MVKSLESKRNMLTWTAAAIAVLFGIVTIKAGGQVLFGSEEARVAAGHFVSFVLWFNFVAGFAYIIAGFGIAMKKQWSVGLSFLIVMGTAVVFAAFGLNILITDVAYEMRTVAAMSMRTFVWTVLFTFAYKTIGQVKKYKQA